MEPYCKNIICLLIFLLSFPKPVAAEITTGGIVGIVFTVLGVMLCCYCCKVCCRKICSDIDDSGAGAGAVVEWEEPQVSVIVTQEQLQFVQIPQGAGIVHTTRVADADGNMAARQSIYAIS